MKRSMRFFEDTTVVHADDDGVFRVDSLPDGRTRIALMFSRHQRCEGAWVIGPRTHAHFKVTENTRSALVGTLKPGWAATLLDLPVSELTNRYVPLRELWGCASFALDANDFFTSFTEVALSRLRSESATARLARAGARLLDTDPREVKGVAAKLGVTDRHLRRAFVDNVGVAPKAFARASRLRRAMQLIGADDDLGRVAHGAGYFDHAHFTTDFKELVGLTPSAYVRRRHERPRSGSDCPA
jgi:AraC-like DNA-binding protein